MPHEEVDRQNYLDIEKAKSGGDGSASGHVYGTVQKTILTFMDGMEYSR